MTLTRVPFPVESYSNRGGNTPRIIVLHTPAGATTNANLGPFLANTANGASYHASVDPFTPDTAYVYVDDSNASWSVAAYNGVALNVCFCTDGPNGSRGSRDYWLGHQAPALASAAQVVAAWSARWGIPLVALSAGQAQGSGRGVCQHSDLGAAGGGHSDCGPGFPMDELLRLAKGPQAPTISEDDMGAITQNPHTVPVPPGAKTLILTADPGVQGTNHVKIRVAVYDTTTKTWAVSTPDCSSGYPVQTVGVGGAEAVSMQVDGGYQAGYGFA